MSIAREARRMGSYLVEETLVLFVVKMDDESVEELSQKCFNLALSWFGCLTCSTTNKSERSTTRS